MSKPHNRAEFPAPDTVNPVPLPDGACHTGTVFLKAVIDHPRISVGEYSYASAFDPPADWAARLSPYLYAFSPERLVIGKFCQIADSAVFITSSANHRYDGISTFPFAIFGAGSPEGRPSMPDPGRDTVIGNDVWIGQGATILPGTRLGDGVIVGAGSVVSGNIPAYHIVSGNRNGQVRARFNPSQVEHLLEIAWWNWPIEKILRHEHEICGADIDALARAGSI